MDVAETDYNEKFKRFKYWPRTSMLTFGVEQLQLSKKQKERLLFLVEGRYCEENDAVRITVKDHLVCEYNTARGYEILRELMYETLRAPLDE